MEKQKKKTDTETNDVTNVIERTFSDPEKSRPTTVTAGIPMKTMNLIQLVSTTPNPKEFSRGEPVHNMFHC